MIERRSLCPRYLTDLDIMDKAIQVLNIAPPQITLEVKFVELAADSKVLGWDGFMSNTNAPVTRRDKRLARIEVSRTAVTSILPSGVSEATHPGGGRG
jgi:hypothetical protein